MTNNKTIQWFADKFQEDLITVCSGKEIKNKPLEYTKEDIARMKAAGSAYSSFCY